MRMKKSIVLFISLVFFCNGCREKKTELSGAGATFPLPYYNMAFKSFQELKGIPVSYGGIGSGGGIRSLKDGIVDFAGTDAYLTDEEMSEMNEVVHVPVCMGAVVVSYNLPGIKELNLTGEIVSAIFMGKIKKWNDLSIQSVNPGLTLPAKEITPVYRSDGSGTTFVFTDYLSKANPEWKIALGRGKSVHFTFGIAAKGNPGVAGIIAQTEGAIGYMGSEYAFAQKVPVARIQNRNGEFIYPSVAAISAASQGDIPEDTRTMITHSAASGAYPISCFTWLLAYKEQDYANRNEMQAKATVDLLRYMLSDEAQNLTTKVHYAPLSADVKAKAEKAVSAIHYNSRPL